MPAHNQLSEFLTAIRRRSKKSRRANDDRAAIVAAAILQIIKRALLDWIDGDGADLATVRGEIELLLRDEFNRNERTPPALDSRSLVGGSNTKKADSHE